MKPLYTPEEFESAKSRQLLPFECKQCHKMFYKVKNQIQSILKGIHHQTGDFCSSKCQRTFNDPPLTVICQQCNKSFRKQSAKIKKVKHHFCSQSCAAKYHNAHKTTGTRCSKLEKWLQEQLPILYPSLEFHFNRRDAINGELDIFIPSLKLAFELNGIFHYEPIFGPEKLVSIQNNDQRKFQACIERGIELCILDVSTMSYFKPIKCLKYLDIISNIINLCLSKNYGRE